MWQDMESAFAERPVLTHFSHIVAGVFTPVLAKHSKSFSLIDCISVGVDRMQRNFEPMRKEVELWQKSELTDVSAKVVIYEAFVEGKWQLPNILLAPSMTCTSNRGTRSSDRERSGVSPNAFTSAFKELDPIPQFEATAKLGEILRGPVLAVVLTWRVSADRLRNPGGRWFKFLSPTYIPLWSPQTAIGGSVGLCSRAAGW